MLQCASCDVDRIASDHSSRGA